MSKPPSQPQPTRKRTAPRRPAPRPAASASRVLSQGYRRYDGERDSSRAPLVSLTVHSIKRALGIRRSAPTKILPVLTFVMAYLPAAAIVGIVALFGSQMRESLPGYEQYYGTITAAVLLFSALVSPELLCSDRRSGMLGLYLTSPLTPWSYLASKIIAILSILAMVTLGPPLLLMIARTLQGAGPDGPLDFLATLGRIVLAGIAAAGTYGGLALAVSSLTDRRAFASAGIALVILVPGSVAAILMGEFDYPRWIVLLTPQGGSLELVQRIFGATGFARSTPTIAVIGAWAAFIAASAGVLFVRYRSAAP